ncbi:MAG: hypothetical protein FWC46_06705, partial [Actinomycetia bacterium]|nr:hypothetical protein [Actinomycetes bacterium]
SNRATPVPPPQAALHGKAVALGRNGQAWGATKTDRQILLRTPHAWKTITLPVAPASGNSVATSGDTVMSVGFQADGLAISTSTDQGTTWTTKTVPVLQESIEADIALSATTGRFVAGDQHVHGSGVAYPGGSAFVGDQVTGVHQIRLPGEVQDAGWAGNTLLVAGGGIGIGGPRLSRSDDGGLTWTDLTKTLTGVEPPQDEIDPALPYFGPVLSLDDGTAVVLQETTTEGVGISSKVLHFLADGTYAPVGSVWVAGNVGGPCATMVASTYGADAIIVAPLTGGMFQVVNLTDGTVSTIQAAGLPSGPDTISFADDANGLAQATVTSCPNGKMSCTSTTTVYATTDGGYTWTAL